MGELMRSYLVETLLWLTSLATCITIVVNYFIAQKGFNLIWEDGLLVPISVGTACLISIELRHFFESDFLLHPAIIAMLVLIIAGADWFMMLYSIFALGFYSIILIYLNIAILPIGLFYTGIRIRNWSKSDLTT